MHAMLRVQNLRRSLDFYCGILGLKEIRRITFQDPPHTLVFLGNPAGTMNTLGAMQIELWHDSLEQDNTTALPSGNSSGHIGIEVTDLVNCVRKLAAAGIHIEQYPTALRVGGRLIAFIRDPDGHEIELLANE